MKLQRLLEKLGACEEAVKWVDHKELAEAWSTCERADWMLWLAEKMEGEPGWPDRKQLILAACACAETALQFVPKCEDRPRLAIETARAWIRGEATIGEVRHSAIDAADSAIGAAYAAAYAAYAAAYAAYAAADSAIDAAYAAAYAADAADAAAYAADAADLSARTKAIREMTVIMRGILTIPDKEASCLSPKKRDA